MICTKKLANQIGVVFTFELNAGNRSTPVCLRGENRTRGNSSRVKQYREIFINMMQQSTEHAEMPMVC